MLSMRARHHRSIQIFSLIAALMLAGCAGISQREVNTQHTAFTLKPGDLGAGGIGFLTPAAATGREADKQALAQSFAKQLAEMRPGVRIASLSDILSAVNSVDLGREYKRMYSDYLETGILDGSILCEIGTAGEVRYLAQLSLGGFEQYGRSRFGLLGLRLLDTKVANLRVFLQIWDTESAGVAWEAATELNVAHETGAERPVTFHDVSRLAAEELFARLP